jgi:hypothetical protein
MTPAERDALITRYADGPALLEAAIAEVPPEALQWRPAPGSWSVHEVAIHCGDSESNSHMRIRFLLGEDQPTIMGYDQDRWARSMDYHAHPMEPALLTVRAVRANTVPLLRRLTEAQWSRIGTHSESGTYGAETWLRIYAEHLEVHARQVRRILDAWRRRK